MSGGGRCLLRLLLRQKVRTVLLLPVSGSAGRGIPVAAVLPRGVAHPASYARRWTVGTVLLPYAPASVAVARQRLAADLMAAGIFAGAVGDAVLVVSELLSNAIRHARPLPGANVQVAWAVDDDAIEVAVSDGGAPTRPTPAHATVSSLGGRGLDIVEYLARTWGVRSDDGGLTVWAVLAAPADALRAAAPQAFAGS
jgi:anti-sigma regulatory factor (Ser/Thr protein kinase)